MSFRMAVLTLAFLCSIRLCAEQPANEAAFQAELTNIRTLWRFSLQTTLSLKDQCSAMDWMHSEMSSDWKGKRLSKWCLYAVHKMNPNSELDFDRFLNALTFRHYNLVQPGEAAAITGTNSGSREGPTLPDDLVQAEQIVWAFVIEYIWPRIVKERKIRFVHGEHEEDLDPPEIVLAAGFPAPCAVPFLATRLGDPKASVEERAWAAKAIGNLRRNAGSVEPLLKGLADPAPEVRAACAGAMGELGHSFSLYGSCDIAPKHPNAPQALKGLLALLQTDPDPEVRMAAVDGLGNMGQEAQPAAETVSAAFEKEADPDRAQRILFALGEMADPRLAPLFIRALNRPESGIKQAAVNGLDDLAREYTRVMNLVARSKLAETAVPALIQALGDSHAMPGSIQALGAFEADARQALPDLQRTLIGADDHLAHGVLSTLGHIGPAAKDAVPLIAPWASKDNLGYMVAFALERIGQGGPEVERALLSICESPKGYFREKAAEALGHVGGYAEEILKKLESMSQSDSEADVRKSAAAALSRLKDKKKAEDF